MRIKVNLPFEEIYGSKVWPSNDPKDSPYNTFKCRLCDFKFEARIFGDFDIAIDPYVEVKNRQLEHLLERHIS